MSKDKYSATWVSYSKITDYGNCPRSYFLKYIYRSPATGNKIQLITPPLSLGSTVHEVIEALSVLPVEKRFETPLIKKFGEAWEKVSGKKGGFMSDTIETKYKRRGEDMIKRVVDHPGPVANKALKIKSDFLPHFWLSEAENIIFSGKIDWLEYVPEDDSVHIIDFKTNKGKEEEDSLQLPSYALLASKMQKRHVSGASYWYLDRDNAPIEIDLPDLDEVESKILAHAKKIKLAIQLDSFKCPSGEAGCRYCQPLEEIVNGKAELVGRGTFGEDLFVLNTSTETVPKEEIL